MDGNQYPYKTTPSPVIKKGHENYIKHDSSVVSQKQVKG